MASPKDNAKSKQKLIAAVNNSLAEMDFVELSNTIRQFEIYRNLPAELKATILLINKPEINNSNLAKMLGVDRGTTAANVVIQKMKRAVRVLRGLPLGTVDQEGFIESYLRSSD